MGVVNWDPDVLGPPPQQRWAWDMGPWLRLASWGLLRVSLGCKTSPVRALGWQQHRVGPQQGTSLLYHT